MPWNNSIWRNAYPALYSLLTSNGNASNLHSNGTWCVPWGNVIVDNVNLDVDCEDFPNVSTMPRDAMGRARVAGLTMYNVFSLRRRWTEWIRA